MRNDMFSSVMRYCGYELNFMRGKPHGVNGCYGIRKNVDE